VSMFTDTGTGFLPEIRGTEKTHESRGRTIALSQAKPFKISYMPEEKESDLVMLKEVKSYRTIERQVTDRKPFL
jgi:hypothetical protein